MVPWLLKERERGRIALPHLDCSRAASNKDLKKLVESGEWSANLRTADE